MLVELPLQELGSTESVNGTNTRDDFLGNSSCFRGRFERLGEMFLHEHCHGRSENHDTWQHGECEDDCETPSSDKGEDETGEESGQERDDDGNLFRCSFLDWLSVDYRTRVKVC